MKRSLCGTVTALFALTAAPSLAAPLEAYGKLPAIEQAKISPDGALLAIVVTNGEQRDVVIDDLLKRTILGGVKAGASKVRDVRWAGPEHLLLTVTATGYANGVISARSEWEMVIDYNVKTKAQRQLLADGNAGRETMNVVEDRPQIRFIKGRPYAFVEGVQFVDGEGVGSLFKVDLDLGQSLLREEASQQTEQWLVDESGETLAQSEYDAKAGKWRLKLSNHGGWRVVDSFQDPVGHPTIIGLGHASRSVLVEETSADQDSTREFSSETVDGSPPAIEQAGEDLIFDDVTEKPIGKHRLVGDADSYSFEAPFDQKIWDATAKAFPGQAVSLESMSQDHHRLVVSVDSPTDGPAYYWVDIDKGTADPIGAAYDKLKSGDIGPVRPIAFRAADGLPLTGYLTLPLGKVARSLPLIVFPHGGPAARDAPGFDWWAQAMASRGYAALQVNFRGSEGFGWDFLKAGFGEWGRKMQTDLSDGVRYLAAQGTIDPKRVCVVGASYGGYAALAGATLDPGVYRCAVSVAGVADLKRMVAWDMDRSRVSAEIERYWDRYMGAKGLSDPHLGEISPVDHIGAVNVPILLIHGKDDTVVPFEQSQLMLDALKKAGKPADLVILNHEDHWLSHGDTRLQMLQATMDFLQKYNPAS